MHDAAFESHTFEGFLILSRVVSFIRIDKCLSWKFGFLQRSFQVFNITFICCCCFFGKYHPIFIRYRVTLVTEMEFSHLLYPTSFRIHIRLDDFFDHCFFRSLRVIIIFSILNDLITLTSAGTTWGVRNACINNCAMLDNDTFNFQLPVKLVKERVI